MKKMHYGLDKNSKFIITDIKQELLSAIKTQNKNKYKLNMLMKKQQKKIY